jgi:predicted dehydrogenase
VRNVEKYAELAEKYPKTRFTDDVERVLGDTEIDAVAIATDAASHFDIAHYALHAGKHVFVEKPMTLDAREGEQLVELAGRHGLTLMVGHLMEYIPAAEAMKDLVASGELGEALFMKFERLNLGIVRERENAWWGLAPHDISLACWWMDAEPVEVSAVGGAYLRSDVEDVTFATLRFDGGQLVHIHVAWLDPTKTRRAMVVGSQKMAVLDDMAEQKLIVHDKAAVAHRDDKGRVHKVELKKGEATPVELAGESPLVRECRHFIGAVRGEHPPRSDGRDGLRVLRVLAAGTESMRRNGAPVPV